MDIITRRTWPFPFLHGFMEDDGLCSCVCCLQKSQRSEHVRGPRVQKGLCGVQVSEALADWLE